MVHYLKRLPFKTALITCKKNIHFSKKKKKNVHVVWRVTVVYGVDGWTSYVKAGGPSRRF